MTPKFIWPHFSLICFNSIVIAQKYNDGSVIDNSTSRMETKSLGDCNVTLPSILPVSSHLHLSLRSVQATVST